MAELQPLTESAIDDAQRIAWRLWRPAPPRPPEPQRTRTRTFYVGELASLDDVADELGVTRQRAQQIEREALKKLRAWCAANGLSLDDLAPR